MHFQHVLPCAVVTLVCGGAFAAEPAPARSRAIHRAGHADGAIDKITLRGDGIEKELDLKADAEVFAKKLKELAEKHKDKRLTLTLELDRELLFAHAKQLHDLSVRAGFKDISWLSLDPKKR
jgi:hypothetical protein